MKKRASCDGGRMADQSCSLLIAIQSKCTALLSKPLRLIPFGFPACNLVHNHGVEGLNGYDKEQLGVGEVGYAG